MGGGSMDGEVRSACELEVVDASEGFGPLLEREYVAEVVDPEKSAEEVGRMLRERFPEFAPAETAVFECDGDSRLLEVGDEMDIKIALRGHCRVRVVHHDDRSITLRTLKGHPEAGRITFGADCAEDGRLTLKILSRTRASGLGNFVGYFLLGKQLQARCWIKFLDRLAAATGGRIEGRIRVRTRPVEAVPADGKGVDEPTFSCQRPGG